MEVLQIMQTMMVRRKRRQLTLGFALLGFVIAAAFFAYFETDPAPQSPVAVWTGVVALVLCPASLLFVTAIDIEVQTTAFTIMWSIVGLINVALYVAVGAIIGIFVWKEDQQPSGAASGDQR
jgi:hypothetical protein